MLRNTYSWYPERSVELFDLQDDLDNLAHSKQQGKDLSELISIFVFATITISLGLLTRPSELSEASSGWAGFLVETFTTLFVSVIVFLAFHLVDMRRDRQIPLIVPLSERKGEYTLFFRYKRDLMTANAVSALVIVMMVIVFASLLYTKWL